MNFYLIITYLQLFSIINANFLNKQYFIEPKKTSFLTPRNLQSIITQKNYLQNGNFSINMCAKSYCIWNTTNFTSNYLTGWFPEPQIQIGYGSLYSSYLPPNKFVVDLIGLKMSCIKQNIVSLPLGEYYLQYDYAIHKDSIDPTQSRIDIKLNDQIVDSVTLLTFEMQKRNLIIFNNVEGEKNFKVCAGFNNGNLGPIGPILNSIKLMEIKVIPLQTIDQEIIFMKNVCRVFLNNSFIEQSVNIPGFQTIFNRFFAFFINLDRLWLYIYHKNTHGQAFTQILHMINHLQKSKFNSNYKDYIFQFISFNISQKINPIDYKQKYASSVYLQIQGYSNTFFINFLDYLCLNLIMNIFIFFLFKKINYFYRLILQQYQYYGYLIFFLLHGYTESFSYFFASDFITLFGFQFQHKMINVFTVISGMIIISLIVGGYFVIKFVYNNKANIFFENCKSNFSSTVFMFIFSSIFDISGGFIHSVGQNSPIAQLFCLFLLQSIIICAQIYFIYIKKKIFEIKVLSTFNIIFSFIRILLIILFLIKQQIQIARYFDYQLIFQKITLHLLVISFIISIIQFIIVSIMIIKQIIIKFIYKYIMKFILKPYILSSIKIKKYSQKKIKIKQQEIIKYKNKNLFQNLILNFKKQKRLRKLFFNRKKYMIIKQ